MDAQKALLGKLLPERDVTQPPPGLDPEVWQQVVIPQDNTMTPERVALGKKLYFETRLSKDGTVACATCHDISRGFTDQRKTSEGVGGALGKRNAPTTMNALLMQAMFHDGRAPRLEDQAKLPILNPIEMAHPNEQAALAAIANDPEYIRMFQAAYGRAPNYEDLARAIAAFQRTFVFLNAPFDRFLAGEEGALSEEAKRGWAIFNGKGRCMSCHQMNPSNPIGTNNRFHNIGVAARAQNFEALAWQAIRALEKEALEKGDGIKAVDRLALETDLSELGRFMVTKDRADIGAFKTMQLRNVGITAPYMHDGSMETLWDVMDHYNKGGEPNPFLDGGIEPLALSEDEIDAVVEFMFTLTDERLAEQNKKAFEAQQRLAQTKRPLRDTDMAERKVLPFERRVMGETK
ncbi:MAG: cytochrome-c peroxidase [Pseudomonadota bacterium]|nr:cytochrome-c peroxidase [Pseudomonadota bacterium]